ncbi:MAG: DUF1080 domain-containing protein [Gammaproteobacteria bacterium]|jgi:hypothetical protein
MKRLLISVVLLLCAVEVNAAHNTLTAMEQTDGWQLLFDGKTTAGWRNYQKNTISDGWQAVNGTLARVADGAGDIVTLDEYGDFELVVDWRVEEGGNSGIFFRASENNPYIFMSAPEVQVLDDQRHRDGRDPLTSAGSNYGLHPAPRGVVRPAGEWNHVRLLVDGDRVSQWLNDELVVTYELGSEDWQARVKASKFAAWPEYGTLRKGYIGLQDHGDPVAFRNIKIRPID